MALRSVSTARRTRLSVCQRRAELTSFIKRVIIHRSIGMSVSPVSAAFVHPHRCNTPVDTRRSDGGGDKGDSRDNGLPLPAA
jgi:hypothetical protein